MTTDDPRLSVRAYSIVVCAGDFAKKGTPLETQWQKKEARETSHENGMSLTLKPHKMQSTGKDVKSRRKRAQGIMTTEQDEKRKNEYKKQVEQRGSCS